jgi:hypothetical protein
MRFLTAATGLLAAICTAEVQGGVQTKVIEYRHGDTVLES